MIDWLLLAQRPIERPYVGIGLGLGMICIFSFVVLLSALWIWALVDAIRNPRLSDNQRIIWVVVILVTHILGAIIYLAAGRQGDRGREM
ncbi:PLD nuclease N-terminal domain-containing protein [Blastopirellula sp. J2-11]|uniref:PLD nuclease N-terminal domain-containing protein n=1 Tax=Blastopirellula sp. J2-11 TaxID=2943192 RepID=UPI0021C678C0|nr:PLD nuclease N-terminal domain-containing protein [Blastopirellula sp. J2-11]UUO08405.1 PLD nuclease N-terminal domain-containing protein [Blastopirellula sp. J2-11]